MAPVTIEDFQIGRVVSRTFGVFARNFVTFLMVALLFMLPALAVDFYLGTPNYFAAGATRGWMFGALAAVVQLLCPYLLSAALVRATITDLNGERPGLGSALSTGFALFLPVLALALMSLFGIIVGSALLLVPGLMLMCGWSVVIPVRVTEHTGIMETFGRSWDLTKGYRWKIFGLLIMYFIVAIVLSLVVALISGVSFAKAVTVVGSIPYISLTWLDSVIVGALAAVGAAAIYYELRTVKEGIAPQQLAAAFD
ncbi:MAG TPA: hypothetical protein VJP60_05435 [Rhizomicrobium sp.]|nr:hypothetical protein [Rhizomicrobium sp.]